MYLPHTIVVYKKSILLIANSKCITTTQHVVECKIEASERLVGNLRLYINKEQNLDDSIFLFS